MDIQHALDIVKSPAMVNVSYRGIPVYIKEVDAQNQTAIVFPLNEMDQIQLVDISGLYVKGPSI